MHRSPAPRKDLKKTLGRAAAASRPARTDGTPLAAFRCRRPRL